MPTARKFDKRLWLRGVMLAGAIALAWKIEQPRKARAPASADALDTPSADRPLTTDAMPAAVANRPLTPLTWAELVRMPWPWWKRVLLNTYAEIGRDRLLAVAAGVVFYALLAIFPAITAFVSFYGLFASYATISDHIALLTYVLPGGGLDVVQDQINRIVARNDGKLSFAFGGGLLLALWSANAGIKAMIDALNVIEDEDESRSFVRLNALSLTLTFGAIVFLLMAIGAVVAFPLVMSTFGLDRVTDTATWLIRWPALLAIMLAGLAVLYRFGPSRTHARWRWVSPGSLAAALLWLAGSAALSLYLSNFADYNATYGSLGAAIGLMMWMWLSTIVVLFGAELDSEIDKLTPPRAG